MKLTKQEVETSIKNLQDRAYSSITEFLVKNAPELGDEQEIREAVLSTLDTSQEQKRIASAFESIGHYLDRHSFPVEMQEIRDNWMQAFEQYTKLLSEEKTIQAEDMFAPLQPLIGLSPKTYEIFYAAGIDLYTHKSYEKAADVFFLLTMLNHCYCNVWISFGLAEQHCGHYESALKAFAMAAITNADSPEPYFCAAGCCIAMHDPNEAKIYLEEGLERLNQDKKYEVFRGIANQIGRQLK